MSQVSASNDPEERARLAAECRRHPAWRKMAEGLAELKRPLIAYTEAGFSAHRGNAARLARRPEIRAYVAEMMDEAAEFAGLTRTHVLLELARVGRANLADFYDKDGKTLRNIKELPRALTAALASFKDVNGALVPSLHDRNVANTALLKYLGGLPDDDNRRGDVNNVLNILSVDDKRTLIGILEALGGGPPDAAGTPAA